MKTSFCFSPDFRNPVYIKRFTQKLQINPYNRFYSGTDYGVKSLYTRFFIIHTEFQTLYSAALLFSTKKIPPVKPNCNTGV